jgi:hypothetical protein
MSLDFTYFEFKDTDGLWKTHPIESVKCLAIVGTGIPESYPAWKSGHCLAIAYMDDGSVTKRIFNDLYEDWQYYQQNGMWKSKPYFQLRLSTSEGFKIPVNAHEGNAADSHNKTHCIFGYIGASFFGLDWEWPPQADKS